jgi:nucleotidyltransferase substrate binding protein (TIGR01987 family)
MADFGDALERLEEALAEPPEITANRDSTILRFTFVYELAWNTMKRCLDYVGITALNPRETIQQAYQQHWIDDEQIWLQMMRDRNLVAHTYKEQLALEM